MKNRSSNLKYIFSTLTKSPRLKVVCLLIILFSLWNFSAFSEDLTKSDASAKEAGSIEDVIPITVGNMRGHRMLYDEGWLVITSSSKAIEYAKENSIISSKIALKDILEEYALDTSDYKNEIKSDIKDSAKTGVTVAETGTKLRRKIFDKTQLLAESEVAYSKESFIKAIDSFVQGNISLVKRTEPERRELVNLPGNYWTHLKSDFSNIWKIENNIYEKFAGKVEVGWEKAFERASNEFKSEYEKSADENNSLLALGHILYGYLKAFYRGVAVPSSKSIVKTGATSAAVAGSALFLPTAYGSVVAGRTIQSAGLSFYYVGKTGVKIVSPTVESGFLSGLSLLSLGSVPATYLAGGTFGVMNQVAFTASAPVAATTEGAAKTGFHTAKYVSFLTYDGVTGVTQVVINQAKSGVVLGYNALTAIPAHLLMGTADGALFLAWDGPRLAVALAQGKIKSGDADTSSFSVGDIPVGTVVDLQKLKESKDIDVKIISEDPAVIKEIIKKLPCDLRGNNEKCK